MRYERYEILIFILLVFCFSQNYKNLDKFAEAEKNTQRVSPQKVAVDTTTYIEQKQKDSQHITSYYADTILKDIVGLVLMGYTPSWKTNEIFIKDTILLNLIDVIDNNIAAKKEQLVKDKQIKDIVTYSIDDKIKFLDHLKKYKLKTNFEIQQICEVLINILDLQINKIHFLMKDQTGNTKTMLFQYLKKYENERARFISYERGSNE